MRQSTPRARLIAYALPILAVLTNQATANDDIQIVRVEETWQLTVGQPNLVANAPQVSMVMSPVADVDLQHFVFELNFKSEPSYTPGGLHIQYWAPWSVADVRSGGPSTNFQLSQANDTIQWRQAMTLNSGMLRFEIEDGHANAWGDFGGQGYLRMDVNSDLPNLNTYSLRNSLDESGISFAGNRVDALTLTRVVWTSSKGQTWVLEAPFDIDTDLDPWDDEAVEE